MRACPRPLAILLAVAVIQSVAWTIVVPAFQGPDEGSHFAYAQQVAEKGQRPLGNGGTGNLSTEAALAEYWGWLHPLLGNAPARPAWNSAQERRWRGLERELPPNARDDGSGPNALSTNPPLYYLYASIPYRIAGSANVIDRLLFMRLAGALLLLVAVLATWAFAGELFGGRRWLQVVCAAIVALHPQLAFLSGVLTTDAMLTTIWCVFAWVAVVTVKRGLTGPRLLGLGALMIASAMTQGRGLALVLPLIATLVIGWRRGRDPVKRLLAYGGGAVGLALVALLVYAAMAPPGGGGVYGGHAENVAGQAVNVREFLSYVWQFYLPKLASMAPKLGPDHGYRQVFIEGYFGLFGALEVRFTALVYDLLQYGAILGLLALWTAGVVKRDVLRRHWRPLVVLVCMVVGELALLHANAYWQLKTSNGTDPLLSGRYLLVLIPVYAAAITFVIWALPRRVGTIAAGALLGGYAFFAIASLGLTVTRFYG